MRTGEVLLLVMTDEEAEEKIAEAAAAAGEKIAEEAGEEKIAEVPAEEEMIVIEGTIVIGNQEAEIKVEVVMLAANFFGVKIRQLFQACNAHSDASFP